MCRRRRRRLRCRRLRLRLRDCPFRRVNRDIPENQFAHTTLGSPGVLPFRLLAAGDVCPPSPFFPRGSYLSLVCPLLSSRTFGPLVRERQPSLLGRHLARRVERARSFASFLEIRRRRRSPPRLDPIESIRAIRASPRRRDAASRKKFVITYVRNDPSDPAALFSLLPVCLVFFFNFIFAQKCRSRQT